eukprot:TRINITY_DN1085_c0_g1_i13.p2 TRINITY_DN1085_c0_g1~~TRINITY_DN1085_c0_g1_i13.p2  ORF type:complete len:256 (-),score=-4.46 TRINITY_DN1085_c0_g1_i13:1148-1915(-)
MYQLYLHIGCNKITMHFCTKQKLQYKKYSTNDKIVSKEIKSKYQFICKRLEFCKWSKSQSLISPRLESLRATFLQRILHGPRSCENAREPIDFSSLLFNENILSLTCESSNKHFNIKGESKASLGFYQYCYQRMNGIRLAGIKAYIPMLIIMRITNLKGKEYYWSDEKTVISQIMSKNYFKMMSAALQLSETASAIGSLSIIPEFVKLLTERYQKHYYPAQDVVIYESIVALKDRSKIVFYIPQTELQNTRYSRK